MSYKVSLVIFLFLPLTVLGQKRTSVSGYVSDINTGKLLAAANIRLTSIQKGTVSNQSGYFEFENLKSGTYHLVISYLGYQHFEKKIKLKEGQQLRLTIHLKPIDYKMDELIIQPQQKTSLSVGEAHVEATFIEKTPTVFQADVFRSLQLLPGIKSASDFSSGLYIRGGSPDQTLILLDGATIYNPSHFFGFFSTFNPAAVGKIRLFKGAYPAKFGGRLGSVLAISSKTNNQNEFHASATLSLLASRASVGGAFKNGSWLLAVRRSTIEPLLAALRKSTESIPNRFYFMDINGKITVQPDDDNRFSLSLYSGMDNLKFPLTRNSDISLNYGNQVFSSSWKHIFSKNLFSSFTLTGSHYFNQPSFNLASTHFNRINHIYDFSLRSDVEYFANDNHTITTGFDLGFLALKIYDEFGGQRTFDTSSRAKYGSFYLQDKWSISPKWALTAGIRLNGFSKGNYLRLEPRLSLAFHATEHLWFQAAFGRYNQFITLISDEAFTGFDKWFTTGKGVSPAYGNQYAFGIKALPNSNFRLDLEVYYRSMKDLFEPDPFLPDRAGVAYHKLFNFGEGYAYGSELLLKYQFGPFEGFTGYTYSITRRKFSSVNIPLASNGKPQFYPPGYSRKHSLNMVLHYDLNTSWTFSAVFNYATGQAYTKPLGHTAIFDLPTSATDQHLLVSGGVNASRLPPYHRLDLGLSRKGSFWGMGKATWSLEVINVYSRRNIWFYDYDLSKNPIQPRSIQLLPLLPTISYSFQL